MSLGTFDAFTAARLGIYAAQHGLNVTGNNISNINTVGYTRQRLDQVSFKAGAYDRYRSQLDNHVGSGALVMGINQVRDPYLDVRFRNTNADVGYNDRMLAGLQEVADILDEVAKGENASENEKGDGLLHAQFQDLADKLRAFEKEPTKANNDLVRSSAENLCALFNKYANKLETLYQDTKKDFDDQVTEINECLTNIRDLNREIRDCEVYGDNALELRDERNRQIDTLSQYLHISVAYSEEDIGCGQKVEKLSIYLNDANPDGKVRTDESMLIDGIFGAQLSSPEKLPLANPQYDPLCKDPDQPGAYRYISKLTQFAPGFEGDLDHVDGAIQYTNKLDKAIMLDNDYFGLQIGKLVDSKNQEWKKTTGVGPEVMSDADLAATGGANPAKAKYTFKLTSDPSGDWAEPNNTIEIGGETYTVGEDGLTLDIVHDSERLAKYIASKLNGKSEDYRITADGDNIVFTARKYGAVGGKGPAAAADLTLTGGAPKLTLGAAVPVTAGSDGAEPTNPAAGTTVRKDGSEEILEYTLINGKWNKTITYVEHTFEVGLDDNDLHGSLQATRELLTEKGEFTKQDTVDKIDEDAAKKRGIRYYQMSLDLLAKEFAKQYNQLNVGYMQDKDGYYIKENGEQLLLPRTGGEPINATGALTEAQKNALVNADFVLKDEKGDPVLDEEGNKIPDLDAWLENSAARGDAVKMEGCGLLFSNRNDRDSEGDPDDPNDPPISAANISVAHSWSTGDVHLVPTYKVLFPDGVGGKMEHSTQNDNAGHMLNMIEKELTYDPRDLDADAVSDKLFTGNFNDMFSNMNTICGQDIRESKLGLDTSYTQLVEIDTSRDGVSGVDLNDEAMNMMQFQKALNASMRLMTVIDEALDRLINNTGVAGR